jgi:hypothetical protein
MLDPCKCGHLAYEHHSDKRGTRGRCVHNNPQVEQLQGERRCPCAGFEDA